MQLTPCDSCLELGIRVSGKLNQTRRGESMHTLVVGGTGMMAGVTKWSAGEGHVVSVVSRGRQPFPGMGDGKLNPITVDYRDLNTLHGRIDEAINQNGPIGLAVFWIHSDGSDAFRVIADEISRYSEVPWRLFNVRGSAAHVHPEPPQVPLNCMYRQVVLGFVEEGSASRWLKHDEISGGVIEAIRKDRERCVVGTVEPWERRPK